MLNVILLLVNLVALLIALGERASVQSGGMQWLGTVDWPQLGQQFWAVTQSEQLASTTVIAAWLALSVLWLSATAFDFFIRQRKAARSAAMLAHEYDEDDSAQPGSYPQAAQRASAGQDRGELAQQNRPGSLAGAAGFAGAMASAQAAQAADPGGSRSANLSDPTLGPLLNDLERQVSNLPAEAQQEIDQLRRALEALVAKP